jgi:DNA-binding SARP family transcriptional activator
MPQLRIQLLGGLRLHRGPDALPAFPTQKSRGLFAFLVLNRARRYPRDVLLGRFWGDSPEAVARKNLRTDLWRIRSVVEPAGVERGSCLSVGGDEVAFNAAGAHWLDVHEFEAALDGAGPDRGAPLSDGQAALIRAAVELYGGDLLEGVYDDWCLFERERLRLRYLMALERLMRHHQGRGEWVDAAFCGQGLLAHDALREHVHRALMRCYAEIGDPAAALRQFDRCARLLLQELEVEPMDETVALRDEIRAGLHRGPSPLSSPPPAPFAASRPEPSGEGAGPLLEQLHLAVRWLDDAGEQLRRAIRDVEAVSSSPEAPVPTVTAARGSP